MMTIGELFGTQRNAVNTTATTASTNKEVKKYLYHPKEWVVGLLLLGLCAMTRFVYLPSSTATAEESSDGSIHLAHGSLLESVNSIDKAWDKMKNSYCKADVEILCGSKKPPQTGGCFAVYRPALSRLWRLQTGGSESYNCSLASQVHRLDDMLPRPQYSSLVFSDWSSVSGPPGPSSEGVNAEDEKRFIKAIIYTFLLMWQDAIKYLPEEPYSLHHRSVSHVQEERQRMVTFQIRNLIDTFQSSTFLNFGEIELERPPLEQRTLLNYIQYARRVVADHGGDGGGGDGQESDDLLFFSEFLPMIDNTIRQMKRAGGMPNNNAYRSAKYGYSLFGDYRLDGCIYQHVQHQGALITNLCELAVASLPHKLNELEMESGGDFIIVTHILMFGANFACLLTLLSLLTARRRLVERMEKGKRRLEQELKDPVLRQSLEHKAQSLPNPQEFIAKLERKASNWDSSIAAQRFLRQTVRRFRYLVLFTVVATTFFFVLFRVTTLSRYLETTMLSLAMFVISYMIPMDHATKVRNARDVLSAIEIATLDPASTESLLSSQNDNSSNNTEDKDNNDNIRQRSGNDDNDNNTDNDTNKENSTV